MINLKRIKNNISSKCIKPDSFITPRIVFLEEPILQALVKNSITEQDQDNWYKRQSRDNDTHTQELHRQTRFRLLYIFKFFPRSIGIILYQRTDFKCHITRCCASIIHNFSDKIFSILCVDSCKMISVLIMFIRYVRLRISVSISKSPVGNFWTTDHYSRIRQHISIRIVSANISTFQRISF